MARQKRGRPVHGWLVVDKPAGVTSATAVAVAKRALGASKAGHAGTLDPAATGLLAIAFGEATKTVPWITDATKTYSFTVRWGAATSTDDAEGEIIATSPLRPTPDEIENALPAFTGDILQTPPQVSAVKVNGARAYDLARAGEAVDLAARPLRVERLELVATPDQDHAEFLLVCGKGGYVRSIARDLGEALGCHAHVAALRRTQSGPFDLSAATPLDRIRNAEGFEEAERLLLPVSDALSDLPKVVPTPEGAARLAVGNAGAVIASGLEFGELAWACHAGRPLAVGVYKAGQLHPTRVFNLPQSS